MSDCDDVVGFNGGCFNSSIIPPGIPRGIPPGRPLLPLLVESPRQRQEGQTCPGGWVERGGHGPVVGHR